MSQNVRRLPTARLCNDAAKGFDPATRAQMIDDAAKKIAELFEILRLDYKNDHNMLETPERVARMLVQELLHGCYNAPPEITEFDNVERYDQLIVSGPIEVRSICAHHLMPIYGHAFVGILPSADGKIIGLSKYDRIVEYFSARPQIQEELVGQIGRYIVDATKPRGVAVRVNAVHMCRTHRGVRARMNSRLVNNAFYGEFLSDPALKSEFLQECLSLEQGVQD
jgi:GTP cyclohydrolase I